MHCHLQNRTESDTTEAIQQQQQQHRIGTEKILNTYVKCKKKMNDEIRGNLVSQSCPTVCNPMDCGPPGFSVRGISQARIPCPPPGDLPQPGIEPVSPAMQSDS